MIIRYNPGKGQFMQQSTDGQYVRHEDCLRADTRANGFEEALKEIEAFLGGSPATALGRQLWKIAHAALTKGNPGL
jgi:hypothetical protein